MPINDIFSVAVYTYSRVHTDIQQTHDNTDAVQEHTGTLHKHTHTQIGFEICLNPSCPHTEIHTYSKLTVT